MHFINIPFRNLVNRPIRSLLTLLGIAVAVGSLVSLVGMSRGLELAWVNSVSERGTHMVAVKKGAVEIMTASIKEDIGDELSRFDGVQAVAGELIDLTQLDSGHTALLSGWSENSYLWKTVKLKDGSLPGPNVSNGVILGQAIAERLKKKPGETIRIRNHEFVVTGIFKYKGVMSNSSIIIPLRVMQDFSHRTGKVTEFNLRIKHIDNPEKLSAIKSELANKFPDLSFQETSELAENNEVLKLLRAVVWGVSIIALLMALVIILNTILMSVTERTREIGILLAIGWRQGRVLAMLMFEGLLLSVFGSMVGTLMGVGGLHWLTKHPRLQGFIEFEITTFLLIQVIVAAVVLGIFGSFVPAWRATKLNTVDALRYE
jgi:putative ABC transport system permease protein